MLPSSAWPGLQRPLKLPAPRRLRSSCDPPALRCPGSSVVQPSSPWLLLPPTRLQLLATPCRAPSAPAPGASPAPPPRPQTHTNQRPRPRPQSPSRALRLYQSPGGRAGSRRSTRCLLPLPPIPSSAALASAPGTGMSQATGRRAVPAVELYFCALGAGSSAGRLPGPTGNGGGDPAGGGR